MAIFAARPRLATSPAARRSRSPAVTISSSRHRLAPALAVRTPLSSDPSLPILASGVRSPAVAISSFRSPAARNPLPAPATSAGPCSNDFSTVLQSRSSHVHLWRSAQVKSGEAEGVPSTEGMILDEQTLQQDLEIAIKEEDYARATKLRDRLRVLHEDSKASVLAANARFYHAFGNGDLAAMHSIWAKGEHVYVIHPGAGRISGYDVVMGSWEIVCGADYEFPIQIDLKNVVVHVRGDVGYVTCTEVVKTKGSSWGKQVATNVFERIDGQWYICIHHASHFDA